MSKTIRFVVVGALSATLAASAAAVWVPSTELGGADTTRKENLTRAHDDLQRLIDRVEAENRETEELLRRLHEIEAELKAAGAETRLSPVPNKEKKDGQPVR